MAVVRPFKGIRPKVGLEAQIASLPYDVMNRAEAKEMAKGNPKSFLNIGRAEINLDDTISAYADEVYVQAKNYLHKMIEEGDLIQDSEPMYYIYRQIMNGRAQTGLVGCTSIDDYMSDIIKKHEHTREEKEIDRINHFDVCNANTEPIFLTYRKNESIDSLVGEWVESKEPVYDFKSEDGIQHILWVVDDAEIVAKISKIFSGIDYLYIADGHHRSASAVKVGLKRRKEFPNYDGTEEFNYFMSVIFPDKDLYVMDYNRVVKDLNGLSTDLFLEKIKESFDLEDYQGEGSFGPTEKHQFGMYLEGKWYKLTAKALTYENADIVNSLDAAVLQNYLLAPVLGIENPRTDKRIDFVGGIRGLKELEKRVAEDMKVAFSLCPVSIEDLMQVADDGKVMPPKSTWFEPKLRSGLFIHQL